MSRNPEKPDEGDWEAPCEHSDVEAKGRHDEAEGGKALVPHQLQDESCDREENLKLLNGSVLQKSHDHSVLNWGTGKIAQPESSMCDVANGHCSRWRQTECANTKI